MLFQHTHLADTVQPEMAEVPTALAPRCEHRHFVEVAQRERPDDALAALAVRILLAELQALLRTDRLTHGLQARGRHFDARA